MGFVLYDVVYGNDDFDNVEREMMKRIVLISGGLDSTALLYKSRKDLGADAVVALFFNYGQKSYKQEIRAVAQLTGGIEVVVKDIKDLFSESRSSLIDETMPITKMVKGFDGYEFVSEGTEVEFRNGVFISCAISLAMQLFPTESVEIAYGATKMREPYIDCTNEFVSKFDGLSSLISGGRIRVVAPFLEKGKDEVWEIAKEYGVPIFATWSCYDGGDSPCGRCPACLDRKILEARDANHN